MHRIEKIPLYLHLCCGIDASGYVLDYKNNNILKTFTTGGGLWANIISTLDGEFLITETDDYGYNPIDESFTTKFFLFDTLDF